MTFSDKRHETDDSIIVSNFVYDSMFRVLAKVDYFDYWLEHIDFTGLSDLDYIENFQEQENLANILKKNGLLGRIESPVYNLAVLFLCGIALEDSYFLLLYDKGKYLFSDEFKKEYNDYLKRKQLNKLFWTIPLFEKFSTLCEKIGYKINYKRNLYNLLKKRYKFGYSVPEELMPFYLAEELINE